VGFGVMLNENPSANFEKKTPENPKKSTPEDREKEKFVKSIGFESIEKAQDIAKLIKIDPKGFEKWKKQYTAKPAFPEKNIKNPERRITKLKEQVSDAPDIVYEERQRTVRVSSSSSDPVTWLRNEYTNLDGIMMCQICQEEMPFKKRNGEYYFEAVELLSKDNFSKEYEAHYIALCPLCAAMYKEWVKQDETAMQMLKETIMKSDNPEIPIHLGELEASLRFVDTHFQSVKHILKET
jgi:hypothetical protein